MDFKEACALDIREGDAVDLAMYVERVFPDYLQLTLKPTDVACEKGGGVRVSVHRGAILAHRPKPIEAFSAVKFAGNPDSVRGRVCHVIGDLAWVCWDGLDTYHEVVSLSALERENRA